MYTAYVLLYDYSLVIIIVKDTYVSFQMNMYVFDLNCIETKSKTLLQEQFQSKKYVLFRFFSPSNIHSKVRYPHNITVTPG